MPRRRADGGQPVRLGVFAQPGVEQRRGDRGRIDVALDQRAPEVVHHLKLSLILHAFRDGIDAECACELAHRRHNGLVDLLRTDVIDEALVDLDADDWKPLYVRQRRVAGSEVVDGDAHPEFGDRLENVGGMCEVFDDHGFGDLESESHRYDSGVLERLFDQSSERGITELPWRQVHRDGKVRSRVVALPLRQLLTSLREHPSSDRNDRAGGLGNRDELVRSDHAKSRMHPAQERFAADCPFVQGIDDRVVVHAELVAFQRRTQVSCNLRVAQERSAELTVEHHKPVPTVSLRFVHRGIRVAQQSFYAIVFMRRDHDSDAGAHEVIVAADGKRPSQHALRIRSATTNAIGESRDTVIATTNSSPPNLATVSSTRSGELRRCAT